MDVDKVDMVITKVCCAALVVDMLEVDVLAFAMFEEALANVFDCKRVKTMSSFQELAHFSYARRIWLVQCNYTYKIAKKKSD